MTNRTDAKWIDMHESADPASKAKLIGSFCSNCKVIQKEKQSICPVCNSKMLNGGTENG